MGKTSELLSLLKTGNSDAARRLILKFKKSGKKKALSKELNTPDDNGQTVIHFCAAQNFVEFLQDLAELGASIDLADNKGYAPLHLAAASGRTSAATALISMGADPNTAARTGDTALHLACHGGHATSVESLVSGNANCTMLNVSGHTPLDLACQSGHAQVVSLLLRSGQFSASYLQRSDMPHTALMLAAKQGHNECIGLLVKHGFDVNRKLPGGNGGTALHEAALYGKVDAVRYLLQCGADVQQTNAQGLTALDVVNMYTDPRTASIMKQVLQDALAQLARTRIAQQHAGQQPPSSGHHTPPSTHLQPAGFSYFSHPGHPQPAMQRRTSGESPHNPELHRQHHPPEPTHRQPSHPQQSINQPTHRQPSHPQQSINHSNKTQALSHSHKSSGHPYQSAAYPQYSASSSHQPVVQSHQPNRPSAGQSEGLGQHSRYHAQPTSPMYQQQRPATHGSGHSAPMEQSREIQRPPAQTTSPSHVQHIYPKPGTPEAVRKAPAIGGDLAAIIAAKAASRKPMVSSPTRKEAGHEVEDDRVPRSMTLGGEPSVQEARAVALRRRSSLSDRSSASPEHQELPTLPRRVQAAGPPSFKPIPPPSDDQRSTSHGQVGNQHYHSKPSEVVSEDPRQRHQTRRPQPRPPSPTSSAGDELMAKLLRRQNKITEAEQAPPEVPPDVSTENETEQEEDKQQRPPPPPQRKTPSLNTQLSSQDVPPPQPTSMPPPEPAEVGAAAFKQLKPKPPPQKPKEVEPEMTPWQQELAARRARLAEHEPDPVLEAKGDQTQNKEPSPTPVQNQQQQQPLPAPKPKRKPPPPAAKAHSPSPSRAVPTAPQEQTLPVKKISVPSPEIAFSGPAKESPTHATRVSSSGEVERPTLPVEVSTLTASSNDQLSRSTSMSSLTNTTGTGSPQLSLVEHMAITEWLTGYKLADYASVLESNGYETTELLVGVSHEELQEMGINKIGHRKKLLSALSNWPQREPFFQAKPESVSSWLDVLRLPQYEQTMLDAGYDDIDFICDITLDDLHDIGISKKGHVKRLLQGIGELTELMKSGLPFPSVGIPQPKSPEPPLVPTPPSITASPKHSAEEDPILPPPQNWTVPGSPEKVDFGRMKGLLEMKMGVNQTHEKDLEEREMGSTSPPSSPIPPPVPRRRVELPGELPPRLPPKKNRKSPSHGALLQETKGRNEPDSSERRTYSVEDITAALGEKETAQQWGEFNQLDAALQGFASETGQNGSERTETEPDQLLADIDDMLADLTTHLDVMIPGSTS